MSGQDQPTGKVTMRDVASKAGLSVATVCKILNGKGRSRPGNARKVEDAVRALGYTVRLRVSPDSDSSGRRVALIVADMARTFETDLSIGAERVLSERNYSLAVHNLNESPERLERLCGLLLRRAFLTDGIILMAPPMPGVPNGLTMLRQAGFPLVMVDRPVEGLNCPLATTNNFEGAAIAVRHLIVNHGCSNIFLLTDLDAPARTFVDRRAGYENTLKTHRRPIHPVINLPSSFSQAVNTPTGEFTELGEFLDRVKGKQIENVGVFGANISMGITFLRACQDNDVVMPRDVRFVCFDDSSWWRVVRPTISAISQNPEILGAQAAEMVLNLIERHPLGESTYVGVPELVPRQSCGCGS